MTTIRQMITSSPIKANELFARLADTSDTAVKTRDRLFAELKIELDLQAELEEQHLFPALKKHKETKALVAEALNDNRETRKLLAELERTPKDSEAFGVKVTELQKVFQQHVRDDKKQFLPAVIKALSDEEASAVVEKIEDEKAQIEAGQRAEADARRDDAKRDREQSKSADAAKDEANAKAERDRKDADVQAKTNAAASTEGVPNDLAKAAQRSENRREAAETASNAAEIVNAGAKIARKPAQADSRGAVDMTKAVRVVVGSWAKQEVARDTNGASAGHLMAELLSEQAQHAMQATMAIGRARTLADVTRAQSDFIGGSVQRMGQFGERYLALVKAGMASAFFPSSRR